MSNNKMNYSIILFFVVMFACTTKIKERETKDDSEDFRTHIRSFLNEYFHIIEASNGQEVFQKTIQ